MFVDQVSLCWIFFWPKDLKPDKQLWNEGNQFCPSVKMIMPFFHSETRINMQQVDHTISDIQDVNKHNIAANWRGLK